MTLESFAPEPLSVLSRAYSGTLRKQTPERGYVAVANFPYDLLKTHTGAFEHRLGLLNTQILQIGQRRHTCCGMKATMQGAIADMQSVCQCQGGHLCSEVGVEPFSRLLD